MTLKKYDCCVLLVNYSHTLQQSTMLNGVFVEVVVGWGGKSMKPPTWLANQKMSPNHGTCDEKISDFGGFE